VNFYNPAKNQWQQLWVDNQGGHLELSGQRKDKQMILSSNKAKDKDGNDYFHRITWTHNDDGSVRQLWETIKDNGDTTVAFDGLYKKSN
jgi:N-acetylneuraminic acid mutarotase